MSLLNFFTQGGQTQLHQLRMIRQVTVATVTAALFMGLMFGGWKIYSLNTRGDLYNIYSYYWANLQLEMPFVQKNLVMQNYTPPPSHGNTYKHVLQAREHLVPSLDVMGSRQVLWSVQKFHYSLAEGLRIGLKSALISLLLMSVLWIWRGRKNKQRKLLSGVQIVKPKVLNALVKKAGKRSNICLGGVRFPEGLETKHMLICGTTGSGKTNCIHELLPQIRAAGQRAVIVDLTGDFVAKYFREGKDILLNPFDARTKGWNPWAECIYDYHYDDLAASLIPASSNDPFWYTAARTLFSVGLKKLEGKQNIKELLGYLTEVPMVQAQRFFQDSKAASLMSKDAEQTGASIRATLAAAIQVLEHVDDSRHVFSIRDWIEKGDDEGRDEWLFLTSQPDQRETLRPLLTTWTGIAISALLSLPPSARRRLWFVMDELPALQQLASLPMALAEGRKYGGCFVLGAQDFNQLDKIYGSETTNSLMGLLNTKIVFRSPDDKTARRLSAAFGEYESSEIMEGVSYGAHHMRDGVSLNDQRRSRPVVPVSDILSLKDLEAYLKFSGHFPPSKTLFAYHTRPAMCAPFIKAETKGKD